MLSSGSHEVPQKPLHIKKNDGKPFSRLLSKESSNMADSPSFRVLYYGGVTGSVPFLWESQPGTPKHPSCDTSLPPLTPPPSYFSKNRKPPSKNHFRSKILHNLFLRTNVKKTHVPSSPSSSHSLSSSSSSSSFSSSNFYGRSRFFSSRTSFDGSLDGGMVTIGSSSPTSTLCFGGPYSMKKAFLAMVGCGSV